MSHIFQDPPRTAEPLPVIHRSRAPVLLLGQASSGTSIAGALLREHLRIAFGTESQFIVHYARALRGYGDLAVESNRRRLLDDLLEERWFERGAKFGYQPQAGRIWQKISQPTLRGVLDAVFADFAGQLGMERWGDKSPEYLHNLPLLGQLFPDAKYIHLVRDGRDVALSHFGRHWGPKSVFCGALEWSERVRWVCEFSRTLSPDQFLEIRYEDLLREPLGVLDRLIPFLEIEGVGPTLRQELAERIGRDVKADNLEKWPTRFTAKQKAVFDELAGDELSVYGYPVATNIRRQPGRWQTAFWHAHTWLAQWVFAERWREVAYKLRLRARYALRRLRPRS